MPTTNFGPPQFSLSAFGPGAGGWSSQNRNPRLLADINTDGNADIVGFGADGVYVSLANGTGGLWPPPCLRTGLRFGVPKRAAGAARTPTRARLRALSAPPWPKSWASPVTVFTCPWPTERGVSGPHVREREFVLGGPNGRLEQPGHLPRELADVNNDQIADIVGFASNGVYVSRGDVIGFFAPESAGAAFWGAQTGNWSSQDTYSRFMADADGDGKPDIVPRAASTCP
jgi:FG-GAP-like repeat